MEYFQIKINDELYTILNTKSYPHFTNTLSTKQYSYFLSEIEKYLEKYNKYLIEFKYDNIVKFLVEEANNFKKFVNITVFSSEIEELLKNIKSTIEDWNLESFQEDLNYHFEKEKPLFNNIDIFIKLIKSHIDDFIKDLNKNNRLIYYYVTSLLYANV